MIYQIKKKIEEICRTTKAHSAFAFNKIAKTKNCYITCAGKTDGIGAQTQAILSTMLFAHDMGIMYVHTPFRKVGHNVENCKDWENKWETFFNLGKDELTTDEIGALNVNAVNLDNPMKLRKKENTLYILPTCHYYADVFPNRYLRLKDRFVEKYNSTSKKEYELHYDPNKINIAVHIRRGDVPGNGANSFRYTDNQLIATLLDRVQSILSDFDIEASINLYSQGRIDNFQELRRMNINFYLDHCVFTTFHNLVSSDILIMSKSSFSYSAALFSGGVKIYEPFWHKPLKDWIVISKRAEFKEVVFKDNVYNILLKRGL